VGPDASDEQIEAIVPGHPVFRLAPSGTRSGTPSGTPPGTEQR
jgi:hypothetical protein